MLTGTGYLNLRDGRKTEVSYQFADYFDDHRAGYLLFDIAAFGDTTFCRRMIVDCDDGSSVVIVVLDRGDNYLAVAGRVLALPVSAD